MSDIQRGLVELLHDLDRRARPGREPRNRAISKYQTLSDTVQLSSDSVATTLATPPYQYARQSYRSAVIADTPVAYWRLGENAPALTANDDSTSLIHVSVTGTSVLKGYPPAGASEPDNAYRFQGTSGLTAAATTVFNFSTATGFSVEAWLFVTSTATGHTGGIFEKTIAGVTNTQYNLYWSNGAFVFRTVSNAAVQTDVVTAPASSREIDAWCHLVGTWDGSTQRIYFNGVLANLGAATTVASSVGVAYVGALGSGAGPLQGYLDEVAVYSGALSSARVAVHYQVMTTPAATGTSLVVGAGQFR